MKPPEAKSDCEYDRLAQRPAKLKEKLFSAMHRNAELKHNAHLRTENRQLREENAQLRAKVEQLGKESTHLEQQWAAACKDSATFSMPPSSDIVKPKMPPAKGGTKRKRGGQPSHKRHEQHAMSSFAWPHREPYPSQYPHPFDGRRA